MKKKHGYSDIASADKTDWARLRAMSDTDVRITADAPRTTAQDWDDAVAHRGLPVPARKEQITLHVDADVLDGLHASGKG